jgi:hypothetical protein
MAGQLPAKQFKVGSIPSSVSSRSDQLSAISFQSTLIEKWLSADG